jgi:hypothetical protein
MEIAFTKKLRADQIQGMFATILFRVSCLPVSSLKTERLKYTKL